MIAAKMAPVSTGGLVDAETWDLLLRKSKLSYPWAVGLPHKVVNAIDGAASVGGPAWSKPENAFRKSETARTRVTAMASL